MTSHDSISVRFWGVRGSIACPGPDTNRYGGNTPCVEIRCGDKVLIFDGGTGIRLLGNLLIKDNKRAKELNLFFTHVHIDHVAGLPFFAPFFADDHHLHLWAGNLLPSHRLEDVVRKLISSPLFPIEVEVFKAHIEYHDFRAGEILTPFPGVTMRTEALDHPDGATGYRLDYAGRSVAYITDTESRSAEIDQNIIALAHKTDLMIFDTTYTDAELRSRIGWGHSTWRQGIRLANAAGAKVLCLFHHDPDHDDKFMDAVGAEASASRAGTIVAKEGMTIEI
jgi:phosphoribosyl 1,2-cyclic phosphodiesterase